MKSGRNKPAKNKSSTTIIVVIAMLISISSITFIMTHSLHDTSLPPPHTFPAPTATTTTQATGDLTIPVVQIPQEKGIKSLPVVRTPGNPSVPVIPVSPPVTTSLPTDKSIILSQDPNQPFRLHFMHIPKCGGTSMTAVLREVMCDAAPEQMKDCCTNPGFCDTRAMRRCAAIKGCVNHFANRPFIYKPEVPSITIMRHPVSRLISAWFYRCHSPNSDCFQVRPEFKLIKQKKKPKAVFDEYLEMNEYNNILTRMLGAGSFPYKNVNITEETYEKAVDALDHMFFVGLQEAYDLSVEVMLRELGSKVRPKVKKERQDVSKKMIANKLAVTSNNTLMTRAAEVNSFDIRLYEKAREKFCRALNKYPDLKAKLNPKKVQCDP